MIESLPRSHPCDLGTEPNRQGFLVLGACPVVPTQWPEVCPPGPEDPDFGILPCRCLRSQFQIYTIDSSATTPLRPHDLVRLDIRAELVCEL